MRYRYPVVVLLLLPVVAWAVDAIEVRGLFKNGAVLVIDGFEPIAFTDNQGYISYNPNTGVNYCETTDTSLH